MEVIQADGKIYVANGQRRVGHSTPTLRRVSGLTSTATKGAVIPTP
jgi:hypothetical protein